MRNALLISIGTLLLPVVITGCYKFIEHSIGGVVLFYSIAGGLIWAVVWGNEVRKKWGDAAAVVAGIPFLVIGFTIVINVFMGLTAAMGEMDYHAM